jgi:hypothetical protein
MSTSVGVKQVNTKHKFENKDHTCTYNFLSSPKKSPLPQKRMGVFIVPYKKNISFLEPSVP